MLKRVAIIVVSLVLIVAGIVMLVTPGPGLVTIVAGLAVLGTEFERPRRWVKSLRQRFNLTRTNPEEAATPPEGSAPE